MQICFYFPALANDRNNIIFGSMYESFFESIRRNGFDVSFTTQINDISGDILVTNIGSGYEKTAAQAMLKFQGPVIINTYNAYINFNRRFLMRWKSRILFAYNPDYATLNYNKYNSLGIPYLHLPLASDPDVFKPLELEKKYDITFLGNGHSGFGREKYIEKLIEYSKRNNLSIFLAGAGWNKFGFPFQIVHHGAETNTVYNQSKICINIHNDRQYAGIEKEMDANNRLFDLAMAGCCQISNGSKMIERYFTSDEVATADHPDEWLQLIDDYLGSEVKRIKMGKMARRRAISEHSWDNRAQEFINFIHQHIEQYQRREQNISLAYCFLRKLDSIKRPAYQYLEIRPIKKLLIFLGLLTKK